MVCHSGEGRNRADNHARSATLTNHFITLSLIFTIAQPVLQNPQRGFCHKGVGRNRVNKIYGHEAADLYESHSGSFAFDNPTDCRQNSVLE